MSDQSTDSVKNDTYGFLTAANPRAAAADKLRQFKPDTQLSVEPSMSKVDAVADRHGFVSREQPSDTRSEVVAPTLRRKKDVGPFHSISLRAPLYVATRFIRFCEENRYSYWQALESLMDRLNIP